MAVTIKSKYSILQYSSCQAINLLTTVCLSLIAAHVRLPSLLPLPLIPVGLRGEWDRKEAPGCKLNSLGSFFYVWRSQNQTNALLCYLFHEVIL